MTPDLVTTITATALFIGPFIVLAIAGLAFGVDSRPGIDARGPQRWMPGA